MKQCDDVTYFIRNTVLGRPAVFNGAVMDYFKKPSQPTQFSLNCTTCPHDVKLYSSNHILVDNVSPLSLTFSGYKINSTCNVTVTFTSFLGPYVRPIKVKLIVELVPCFSHIGYTHSKGINECVCYPHGVVKCNDHYNEIKDGYWIGVISSQPTTSLCPTNYCSFIHRNKMTLSYSELPDTIDAQCNHNRTGRACGECCPEYTLAYDTADCISVDHCNTGSTVLVALLTFLYWIIIVVVVFILLYFINRLSLGYMYGIIYYYSMARILFSSNPYIAESALFLISVMSSFTQLSPQFLGKLCLAKGLSGIDQLFIHYIHPIGVSFLVIGFTIAAKYSYKLSAFVGRCIIKVICLLLLLSYTSIASTSLQLLSPLKFTDIAGVYTYSSPSIQYFYGRHAFYGIIAIVFEAVVVIGLPLFLLMEPFINKKINFIKIKPLLDQFQGCYKDRYRWFASYYLICRQIIIFIVFWGNSNYNRMYFYLQTMCIVIAAIHMWIRPYKSASLNFFDELILQTMVVCVSINVFAFLQSVVTELVVVLVIFPLFVICIFGIRKVVYWYANRRKLHRKLYVKINENDEDLARFVN